MEHLCMQQKMHRIAVLLLNTKADVNTMPGRNQILAILIRNAGSMAYFLPRGNAHDVTMPQARAAPAIYRWKRPMAVTPAKVTAGLPRCPI